MHFLQPDLRPANRRSHTKKTDLFFENHEENFWPIHVNCFIKMRFVFFQGISMRSCHVCL